MHEATRQSSENIIADIYDAPRWRKVVGEPSLGLGRIGLEYCVDGTPILDIKPYLPYVDSYPESEYGWLENQKLPKAFELKQSADFTKKLQYLKDEGKLKLLDLVEVSLQLNPYPRKGNRIECLAED